MAIFTAAKNIVDIVQTCQDNNNNALSEWPQIEFAVSQAAFVCFYVTHFQQIDISKYIYLRFDQSNVGYPTEGYSTSFTQYDLLIRLRAKLPAKNNIIQCDSFLLQLALNSIIRLWLTVASFSQEFSLSGRPFHPTRYLTLLRSTRFFSNYTPK